MDTFDIQKYINMAIRRKWWIIIPFLVVLLGGFAYLLVVPKIYEAQTLILIVQQEVPEDILESVVTSTIDDRLLTIEQQVKSRTNLEKIITEYGLYESTKKYALLDEKVAHLREMIAITAKDTGKRDSQVNNFTISFRNDDPEKTMRVTNALASNFLMENYKIREEQASGTSTFLEEGLLSIEKSLKIKEEEIKEYKERYMGGLPEQLQTNLTRLQMFQSSLDQYNSNLRDAENRRAAVLKDIAALSNTPSQDQSSQSENGKNTDNLASKKEELLELESRYTENHPDIIELKKQIERLEKEKAESQAQSSSVVEGGVPDNIASSSVNDDLKSQLEEIEIEIAKYKGDIEDTNHQIKLYQDLVDKTPKREQEMLSLNRDYENLKDSYSSLLDKKYEVDLAVNMEKKQKDEQMKIIDFAKIPEIPVEPDVPKIILTILALGLGLGCGLSYLMEILDTSYRTPDDIEKEIQLPVLANFPYIFTEIELKDIKRKNILAYAGVGAGFILSVAGILIAVKGVAGFIELVKGVF